MLPGGHFGNSAIKKVKGIKRLNRDSKDRNHITYKLADKLAMLLKKQGAAAAKHVVNTVCKSKVKDLLSDFNWPEDWDQVQDLLGEQLIAAGKLGTVEAYAQLKLDNPEALELANKDAIEFAKSRAAELVGKRITEDGDAIDNPNSEYNIEEATREMLRADITEAIEQGLSNEDLAKTIESSYAFSSERALTIARTETAFADCNGNKAVYERSGVVSEKTWIVGDGCCPDCQELDGETVPLTEKFSNGVDTPPGHPNCRCDFLPVLNSEQNDNSEND